MTELQQRCLDAIKKGPCGLYNVCERTGGRIHWWYIKVAVDELEAMGLVESYMDRIYPMIRAKEATSGTST